MSNIKPVSDLSNYMEVLKSVSVSEPVFLTEDGRERYVIVDIDEYEKTKATIKLMNELYLGRKSGEEEGWIDFDEFEKKFGIVND